MRKDATTDTGPTIIRVKHLLGNDFLRQSSIVFLASIIGCLFSYLYQIYVGRALGPEGYGTFGSLFAIFYLISIFAGTIQTAGARFVSDLYTRGRAGEIGPLLYGMLKKSAALGAIGFAAFYLIRQDIAGFLKIDSQEQVLVLGTILLASFLLPAVTGAVQGLQRFYLFAFLGALTMGLKFLFGVLLVSMGFGVSGALGAVTLATVGTLLVGLFVLRPYLGKSRKNADYNFKELYLYSAPALLVMVCLAVPSNADVILAKHFFNGHEAGLYTAASVIGKIVLFLPSSISAVMFPKAAEKNILGEDTLHLLNRSLLYTGLLSGLAAAAFAISPSFIGLIFGAGYTQAAGITGLYAVAMALFSMTWVVAQYCLAVDDLKYTYLLVAVTALELGIIALIHGTVVQMAEVLVIVNFVLFILSYLYVILGGRAIGRERIEDLDHNARVQRGAQDIR